MVDIIGYSSALLAQKLGCKKTASITYDSTDIVYVYNDSGVLCVNKNYSPDFDLSNKDADIIAPTIFQIVEWLAEEKSVIIAIEKAHNKEWFYTYKYDGKLTSKGTFKLFKDAVEKCIFNILILLALEMKIK